MKKQRPMRVHAYTLREPAGYGYVGTQDVSYQELQEKRWWGWKTLDREVVPGHVRISQMAFGDTGYPPWESKFADRGSWGRDGVFTPDPA